MYPKMNIKARNLQQDRTCLKKPEKQLCPDKSFGVKCQVNTLANAGSSNKLEGGRIILHGSRDECNFEMRNDFVCEESDLAKFTVILHAT